MVSGMYSTQKTVPLETVKNNVQFIQFINALFPLQANHFTTV